MRLAFCPAGVFRPGSRFVRASETEIARSLLALVATVALLKLVSNYLEIYGKDQMVTVTCTRHGSLATARSL